jgi:regulator of RNase E activity RraA
VEGREIVDNSQRSVWAKEKTVATSPTAEQLDFLRSIDSPTIANAIEPFKVRDRAEGYIGGSVRAMFPELGVMLGYALTVAMTNRFGPPPGRAGWWRMWEELEKLPRPSVVVVQDVSGAPTRCAYFGEVMATVAKRLGAVGIVSDGGVRDLPEVRAMGLHYFAPYAVASHGNFEIVDVGGRIRLDGQEIRTGDLLHGDLNGIVIVPTELVKDLPAEVEKIRTREAGFLKYINSPEFNLDDYKGMVGY